MPKISVIVPVFNMEKYIKECIESILCQTLTDIEVILINDGSTDSSLEVMKKYQKRDNRVIIINKKNEGVGAARNDGIKAATGDFLAFIDPDDMYASENVLLHCYEAAIREAVSIVGGKTVFLYQDGSTKEEAEKRIGDIKVNAKGLTEYIDYQYDYGYVCFIYERKLIVDNHIYFPLYSRFQDPPFFVKAMISAKRFYALDENVYLYRQLPGVSKLTVAKTIDFLRGIMDNLKISKENHLPQLHYITAERLNTEGSYMAMHNLESAGIETIIYLYIRAAAMIDVEWLKDEGFLSSETFVPEVFEYMLTTSMKYEKLRKNILLRGVVGAISRLSRVMKK